MPAHSVLLTHSYGECSPFPSDSGHERWIVSSFSRGRTMSHCVLLPVRVFESERGRGEEGRGAEPASNGGEATAETGETAVSLQGLHSSCPPSSSPHPPTMQHGQGPRPVPPLSTSTGRRHVRLDVHLFTTNKRLCVSSGKNTHKDTHTPSSPPKIHPALSVSNYEIKVKH